MTWAFRCPSCERVETKSYPSYGAMQADTHTCTCGRTQQREPSAPNFSISGYSAKNGYSAS